MKVFWVYAHPEPRSLNGSLKNFALATLARHGHETQFSDLYAMNWNAAAGADDFPQRDCRERMEYTLAQREAYEAGALTSEIAVEHQKLLWCDTLILQFPFWWFSMPAILKGWIDRVWANGLTYGQIDHSWPGRKGRSLRYGHGVLAGRRAMLLVTTAGDHATKTRSIAGKMDDLLYHINHGMLWYAGFTVMPTFLVTRTKGLSAERYDEITQSLEQRLIAIPTAKPIPYRKQNTGDYDEHFQLKEGLEGDTHGFDMHVHQGD